jgi:hypothetical protein
VELVPSQASPERNFKQSSPSAFGEPHLFGKCDTLAYAIRDTEAVTLPRAAALKERETATSRSQTRRLNKGCDLVDETVFGISAEYLPRKRLPTLYQPTCALEIKSTPVRYRVYSVEVSTSTPMA